MNVDGLTAAEPARFRRLWLVLAAILPVVVFAGGAAWFIRTYVAPPTIAITAAPALASVEPTASTPPPLPETTGTSRPAIAAEPPQPAPPMRPAETPALASPFPPPPAPAAGVFPPPPAPPDSLPSGERVTLAAAPQPDATPADAPALVDPQPEIGHTIDGPVPLPPRRPRISLAVVRGPVPLPRPRPGN